jgi:excisionase family DNA binding protein
VSIHVDTELAEFLTRKELAELTKTTVARVRQWDRRGLLPRVNPPGTRLILYPRAAVMAWLKGTPIARDAV